MLVLYIIFKITVTFYHHFIQTLFLIPNPTVLTGADAGHVSSDLLYYHKKTIHKGYNLQVQYCSAVTFVQVFYFYLTATNF